MPKESYQELRVWQRAMDLAVASYRGTAAFPPDERFGLTAQIRRAAGSIPANIAEGNGRLYRGDYIRHASVARGSVKELEVHFHLAERLGYTAAKDLGEIRELCDAVSRMLTRLIRALQPKP